MPWIGAAIGAGASLLGGSMASDAAGQAANAQGQASAASIAEQRREYDLSRSDNAPFRNTGIAANARLAQLLGLPTTTTGGASSARTWQDFYNDAISQAPMTAGPTEFRNTAGQDEPANFQNVSIGPGTPDQAWARAQADSQYAAQQSQPTASPGAAPAGPGQFGAGDLTRRFQQSDLDTDPVYQSGLQFGLDEGTKGVNARAIQAGGYDSGATLKALTRFANDYGSTKANDSYNRFTNDQNNTFNKLSGISGSGQVATNAITQAGTNEANNVSSSIDASGNARAAGIVGGSNAWGSAFGGVNNAVNQYQNNQILQKLLAGNSGSTPYFGYSGYGSSGDYQYG